MQLRVTIGSTGFIALLDSGSTHNFISESTVSRAGLTLKPRPGLHIEVANGDHIASRGLCRGLPLVIDSGCFTVDRLTIPLGSFDIVLGIQWLRTLGPTLWDFDNLRMSFWRNGRCITWVGIAAPRMAARATACKNADLLDALLLEFESLFAKPVGLPLARHLDHQIHLPGSAPMDVRPYRYPHHQKDELERQCATMLQQGTIRPSSSAFSSPVLLVKKHDGTCRFCVDYRTFNELTVKDKFPTPVIYELIDELRRARFFSKLDLSSDYRQVRMHPADMEKTAFRTHHGHFEFL